VSVGSVPGSRISVPFGNACTSRGDTTRRSSALVLRLDRAAEEVIHERDVHEDRHAGAMGDLFADHEAADDQHFAVFELGRWSQRAGYEGAGTRETAQHDAVREVDAADFGATMRFTTPESTMVGRNSTLTPNSFHRS
jgi:hypothetical protein